MSVATEPLTEVSPPEATSAVPPDSLYEVVDGRVVEKPAMGAFESTFASRIFALFALWAQRQDIGEFYSEVLFDLRPAVDRSRRPDLAFVSYDRWPKGRPVPHVEAWPIVPDLAIEVISPSNTADDVLEKLDDYFRAGVRRVWVIHPRRQVVYDYSSQTNVNILLRDHGHVLDGVDVLPGFRLALGEFFGEPSKAEGAEGRS